MNEINAVALIWFEEKRSSKHWNLTLDQASVLLGGISHNTYNSLLNQASNEHSIDLSSDLENRLSLLLGIHKAIALSSPKGCESDFWDRPINHPIFQRRSVKEVLLANPSVLTFYSVRRHLEDRCK
ncbi:MULTISPECIES: hypothetical protein [unclassified Marinomonas]|uniref:hypothetical protein n=1 Tax=unclassified Marinomonas TaxID=196814 RepID=UPI0012F62CC7|nr:MULTISPECIES: hypothetical protein [unclassified Marinomonas]